MENTLILASRCGLGPTGPEHDEFFHTIEKLTAKVAVGEVGGMDTIIQLMADSSKVVTVQPGRE